jgi:hypothetical protein
MRQESSVEHSRHCYDAEAAAHHKAQLLSIEVLLEVVQDPGLDRLLLGMDSCSGFHCQALTARLLVTARNGCIFALTAEITTGMRQQALALQARRAPCCCSAD